MKRLLTLAVMFLCCMATTFAQFSGSGSGTENDPYLILNPIQLNQMRNFLGKKQVFFKLMADINLTEFIEEESPSQGWQPIGTSIGTSDSFQGVFDGNGHTISGLWINRPNANCIGLFANTYSATIKNLNLNNANVKGKDGVGLLVGSCSSTTITNCTLSGKLVGNIGVGSCVGCGSEYAVNISEVISETEVAGLDNVGGIIGAATGGWAPSGSIENCTFKGSTISGNNYIGGICGISEKPISNCIVMSNIEGNNFVGGVCGQTTTINNCQFWGYVTANSYVGGICGYGGGISEECYAVARIKGQGDMVGGLFGYMKSWTFRCYFSGTVDGNEMVGGLVGKLEGGLIGNCYANTKVSGAKYVGGICGYAIGDGWIDSNVAILSSVKATNDYVGRIYGFLGWKQTAKENKAFNRTIVIKAGVAQDVDDDKQNGTGVSATTLKLKATYVAMGWNFTDTWSILETECYPYFKTQTAPPVITSQVVSGVTAVSGKCVDGGTITLEIDGVKQQTVSNGNTFSFNVSPLQVGQEIWVSAKAEGKDPSYYAMATVSFMGKGTESDPYQIYTAGDLKEVYRKGYFKLMNDIDLTSYINTYGTGEGWEAIGRDGSETIYFDGNGHKITGLWCNTTRDNTGLFSCFANGYIKNLTVETASGKQVKGGKYTGIIIGKLINGEIMNCKAFGTVADGTPVGGMIGKLDGGKLSQCQADVSINVTGGNSYVGGLAGEITGNVEECLSNGTLTATGANSYVGGLLGMVNSGSNITNCYSNAKVSSSFNAAGLVAYNYGIVDKCYATGDLFSKNYGAGVIGYNDGAGAVVKNCVAMNNKIDVTYESQSGQGGGYGQRIIGGIKNSAPAPEMNNFALKTMQVSQNNVPQKVYDDIMNGTSKTYEELLMAVTYQNLDWNLSEIWKVDELSYPSLRRNPTGVESQPVPYIVVDDKTREYGEANPELTFKVSADITGTPQLTTTATKTSPVGVYDIVVERGTVVGNYTSKNGKLTVTKAPLSISGGTYTIKQGEALPTFVANYSGFKNNETDAVLTKKPTLTTTATSSSAPGEYEVTVSGAEAQNYNISYTKGKLTITKADPVTVTAKSYTRVYGEANPTFEYTTSGAALSGTPQISCTATATSPVGTYDIIISQGSVSNYNVTYVKGTLTITKAPLTIKAGTYTKKQGEDNPNFTLTYEGFKNNETEAVLTKKPTVTCDATKGSQPGDYAVKVSGAEAKNYDISYVNGVLKVTEADAVIVTAKSYTRVYGDANPTFEYTSSGAALSGKPQISCSATATSPVGTYDIIITQGSVTNYNVTYVKGTLTITKAPLTIKAGTYTKKQGEDNPTFTLTYEGFKNNETEAVLTKKPTVTCDATKGSQPGDYAVKVSGAEAKNYDISYVNGVLKVTEADAVIVTAKSYTRVYSDVNPIFEYTTSGAALSGTPQISCAATATSPVGTYDIIVSQGSVTNYNVTYVKGTLTITKAPLTISVGNYTKIEGEDNPTFEATYSGFKNNETEKVLTKRPTITTTATKTSPIGEYPVTVSGAEARNYDISYIDGVLTIMKDPNKFDENGASYEKQGGNSVFITGDEGATGEYDIPESVTHDGVTLPVTGIGEEAYKDNIFISQVTIPSSVTFIGKGAFAGCTNLMTIIIYVLDPIDISKARTRSSASSVFEGVDKNYCILYVPDVSVTKYRAAEGWKEFRDIRGISTLGINEVIFEGKAMDVYDLNGRKVLRQATSLHELPKGVYIINGRKVVK